ncbi:hypothetical protein [Dactylosporangium salmoneum]|uniref:Uncharacterized protein n=1 Tax=Dactylosporangium salmoneum TaxID=53361 RepID=A0ABN3GAY9_9ACTN
MNVILPEPIDAVAPFPNGQYIWLGENRFLRDALETAWLVLQEVGGDRYAAADALWRHGWDRVFTKTYVLAAEGWTGNVVEGEVA